MSRNSPAPRRGRPLSREVERAVYDEAMRLVAAGEPSEITRRAIADGAGVSRQTLYNRWATTADIVLAALIDRAGASIDDTPASGVRGYLEQLAAAVNGWARPGLRSVVAFAQLDPDFAERFRAGFLDTRHAALTNAVRAAMSERAEDEVGPTAELVAGSLWFRVLIADRQLDEDWIDRMVALVSAGAEVAPAPRVTGRGDAAAQRRSVRRS